jgi:hypothetical protein
MFKKFKPWIAFAAIGDEFVDEPLGMGRQVTLLMPGDDGPLSN